MIPYDNTWYNMTCSYTILIPDQQTWILLCREIFCATLMTQVNAAVQNNLRELNVIP